MRPIIQPPPRKPSQRTFATVATTSGLSALTAAIGLERRRASFQIVPVMDKVGELQSFDLRLDPTHHVAAIETVRSLLGCLMDASDRGDLHGFEITLGGDLLRRPGVA